MKKEYDYFETDFNIFELLNQFWSSSKCNYNFKLAWYTVEFYSGEERANK